MSYILEALKRAERERKLGQAPAALDEVAAPPPVAKAKPGPRSVLIGVAAIVVAALAGYAVFLFRGAPPAAPAAAPEAPVAAAQTPAPVTVVATPDGAVDARIEDGGQIASLDDLTDPNADPAAAELAAAQQAAALQAQAATAYSPDAAQGANTPSTLRAPNPATSAPRPQPAPVAVPPPPPTASSSIQLDANPLSAEPAAAIAAPEPTPAPPPVAAASAPEIATAPIAEFRRLKDMPAGFRAEFPPLSVDVHVYNDNPQRRFVLITGKRYRETDVIAEGPRIARIVPEGIVFDWRNEQVLFPVR